MMSLIAARAANDLRLIIHLEAAAGARILEQGRLRHEMAPRKDPVKGVVMQHLLVTDVLLHSVDAVVEFVDLRNAQFDLLAGSCVGGRQIGFQLGPFDTRPLIKLLACLCDLFPAAGQRRHAAATEHAEPVVGVRMANVLLDRRVGRCLLAVLHAAVAKETNENQEDCSIGEPIRPAQSLFLCVL